MTAGFSLAPAQAVAPVWKIQYNINMTDMTFMGTLVSRMWLHAMSQRIICGGMSGGQTGVRQGTGMHHVHGSCDKGDEHHREFCEYHAEVGE